MSTLTAAENIEAHGYAGDPDDPGPKESWSSCVGQAASETREDDGYSQAIDWAGRFTCVRAATRFDTSSAGSPATAKLRVYHTGGGGGNDPTDFSVCRFAMGATLATDTNYAAIRTGYQNTNVGALVLLTSSWYESPDIVAAGQWAESASFCLAVYNHVHDNAGASPDPTGTDMWSDFEHRFENANAPYLELTYGNRCLGKVLLGVGYPL